MRTLSLKCSCGFVKHDVMCLGEWANAAERLLKYCGGLFIVSETGDDVSCNRCSKAATKIEFHCAFCGRVSTIPVTPTLNVGGPEPKIINNLGGSFHKTVVFSAK